MEVNNLNTAIVLGLSILVGVISFILIKLYDLSLEKKRDGGFSQTTKVINMPEVNPPTPQRNKSLFFSVEDARVKTETAREEIQSNILDSDLFWEIMQQIEDACGIGDLQIFRDELGNEAQMIALHFVLKELGFYLEEVREPNGDAYYVITWEIRSENVQPVGRRVGFMS